MIKKITLKWLKRKNACVDSVKWFENQTENDPEKVFDELIIQKHFDYAGWILVNLMTGGQQKKYAWIVLEYLIIGINDNKVSKIFNNFKLALTLAHVHTHARALTHAFTHIRVHHLTHHLARNLTRDLALPRDLTHGLTHALAHVHIIDILDKGWDILTNKTEEMEGAKNARK